MKLTSTGFFFFLWYFGMCIEYVPESYQQYYVYCSRHQNLDIHSLNFQVTRLPFKCSGLILCDDNYVVIIMFNKSSEK